MKVSGSNESQKDVRIGLLGASGYTGAEIVRLLANHPYFGITLMTADRKAGQSMESVFPHLIIQDLPKMIYIKDADFSSVDAVFCCLPHGTTQDIIKGLPKELKIVDLSADFRLRDIAEYEEWYLVGNLFKRKERSLFQWLSTQTTCATRNPFLGAANWSEGEAFLSVELQIEGFWTLLYLI
ncbi:probable N-acetyl-gamma-glutamyl-phosphate reductase, chloroplastic isoform X2 [Carica papaya]|uniref:probable N-acetyl-gamma-glutamyl-phosphate reductase, chloroplastic isoform X2 n=1 Tax=Carica papaya TaxID=3649 RepID=UPI000B8CCF8A|nr:probable N-acetyl-gamma-glutamyl-phosphate reductase, chloroplastic isoform X2 [Carica papaya]